MAAPGLRLKHAANRLRRLGPAQVAAASAILIASVYTAWLVRFAVTHSSFHGGGDDIEGFWQAKHLPFWTYLFTPIDVHRLPLHRLASYVLFRTAGMNFVAASAVLVAFHLAGCA